jgi:hypothetical protein
MGAFLFPLALATWLVDIYWKRKQENGIEQGKEGSELTIENHPCFTINRSCR